MITYADAIDDVVPDRLTGFFQGWMKAHTPEEHLRILEGSDHVVLAFDSDNDRVVGFHALCRGRPQRDRGICVSVSSCSFSLRCRCC